MTRSRRGEMPGSGVQARQAHPQRSGVQLLKGVPMTVSKTKTAYEAPALRAHGSIEKLTQGGVNGNFLDAMFPAGTPRGDLTFS